MESQHPRSSKVRITTHSQFGTGQTKVNKMVGFLEHHELASSAAIHDVRPCLIEVAWYTCQLLGSSNTEHAQRCIVFQSVCSLLQSMPPTTCRRYSSLALPGSYCEW